VGLADTSILDSVLKTSSTHEAINGDIQSLNESPDDASPQLPHIPKGFFAVARVVDGDTVVLVDEHGEQARARLIGVDAPESVHPSKPVACFGVEAAKALRLLAEGKLVTVGIDASQGDVDRYGRTLAYLFLEDGTFINEWLIAFGYAYEYTYNKATPYEHQAAFVRAEEAARSTEQGLWAEGACSEAQL
jgi:micrococcal nuclease